MKLYAGIDLHSKNNCLGLIDDQGKETLPKTDPQSSLCSSGLKYKIRYCNV
jgi:hypothetical protein